jgi:hypothetical protein
VALSLLGDVVHSGVVTVSASSTPKAAKRKLRGGGSLQELGSFTKSMTMVVTESRSSADRAAASDAKKR